MEPRDDVPGQADDDEEQDRAAKERQGVDRGRGADGRRHAFPPAEADIDGIAVADDGHEGGGEGQSRVSEETERQERGEEALEDVRNGDRDGQLPSPEPHDVRGSRVPAPVIADISPGAKLESEVARRDRPEER
jgi:hypothetical protein